MSESLTDDWTEEKTIQLIREYRARPILWDPLDAFFYKKTFRSAVWDDIGHVLNTDGEECKHKMTTLMRRLKKENEKHIEIVRNESGESVRKYTSNWFGFKEIEFLLDKDAERKRRLEGVTVDDEEISSSIMIMSKRKTEPPRTIDMAPTITGGTNISLEIIKKEEEILETGASTSRTLSDSDEEIKSFTTFIGNKMRQYKDETRSVVQQAICKIIFQADQNYNKNKDIPSNYRDIFHTNYNTDQHKEIKEERDSYSDSE